MTPEQRAEITNAARYALEHGYKDYLIRTYLRESTIFTEEERPTAIKDALGVYDVIAKAQAEKEKEDEAKFRSGIWD